MFHKAAISGIMGMLMGEFRCIHMALKGLSNRKKKKDIAWPQSLSWGSDAFDAGCKRLAKYTSVLAADEESQPALPEELASLDGVAYLKLVPRLAAYASLRLDVGKLHPQISFVGQGVCVEQVCEMESIMKDITRVLQPFYTPQSSEPEPPWELKWNNDDQFLGKVYYALMTAEIPELIDVARHIINNSIKLGKFELEKGSKLVEATGLKNLIEGQDELDKDMILAAAKSKEANTSRSGRRPISRCSTPLRITPRSCSRASRTMISSRR